MSIPSVSGNAVIGIPGQRVDNRAPDRHQLVQSHLCYVDGHIRSARVRYASK